MKLLFDRTQATSTFGAPIFKLHAKVELEEDETAVLKKYRFEDAQLVSVDQPGLFRNAAIVGLIAAVIAWLFVNRFPGGLPLMIGLGGLAGWFFYDRKRETVFVRDLIHGRYFDCASVIDLARKEAWLGVVTSFLRQVMESATHWDGTETREIEALSKEEAKYVVIRGL